MADDGAPTTSVAVEPAAPAAIRAARAAVLAELDKVIVGQAAAVEQILAVLFAGGHCLIQGPPATAKTTLAATIARVLDLSFKRIQFTPDLMPSDISGTEVLEEDASTGHRTAKFVAGPVFCNLLMADEINRTPPKTQAALLEAMQEHQVTLGGRTYPLPEPFFVLATQIANEQDGTYPLPEAQQDRFMFSVLMDYLSEDEELAVVRQSTGAILPEFRRVTTAPELRGFAATIRQVALPAALAQYIVTLVDSSRPTRAESPDFIREYVTWGAGLRASQNIALGAKAFAAMDGRETVALADVRRALQPVLRHRLGLSFKADVDRVTVNDLIARLATAVPEP